MIEYIRIVNNPETARFKDLIQDRLTALEAENQLGRDTQSVVQLDQQSVGRLNRMDALQQQAMAQATDQRRELEIRRISAALKRLETDDFGYCLECDDEIARGRLEFDPSLTLCIDCAD